VRCAIAFGAAAEALRAAFASAGVAAAGVRSVEEAVTQAFAAARPGDEILFSPACASFDQYRNFRDRALAFRSALPAVDELAPAVPSSARRESRAFLAPTDARQTSAGEPTGEVCR
jgi:hypothetical protein